MPDRYVSHYFFAQGKDAKALVELYKKTEAGPWMLYFRWGVRGEEPMAFEVPMTGVTSEARAKYKARQSVRSSIEQLGIPTSELEETKVGTWNDLDALEKLIAQGWPGVVAHGVRAGSFDV